MVNSLQSIVFVNAPNLVLPIMLTVVALRFMFVIWLTVAENNVHEIYDI